MKLDIVLLQSISISLVLLPFFIFSIILAFYIPGRVILGKALSDISDNKFSQAIISLTLGMVLWAYQGVIFGYLNIRFATYLYIALFFIFWIKYYRPKSLYLIPKALKAIRLLKKNFLLVTIFIVGIFGQTQQLVVTGLRTSEGIYGFTVSFDDALWHTGLISSLVKNFPPVEPGLVGVNVYNYHYWSNTIISEIIRVFHFPLLTTQYIYMYVLLSFLLGAISIVLAKKLNLGNFGILIFVYLQYFASDIIYLLTFITRQEFIFSIHPLEDGTMFLENPPRAFSFIFTLLGLILLVSWLRNRNFRIGIILVMIFGSIVGMKVHTGIMVMGSLFFLSLYFLINREIKSLYLGIGSLIVFILIYLPVNAGAGVPVLAPFEMTSRTFVAVQDLGIINFELARQVYQSHNNFLQAFRMDIIMLFIFLLTQLGIRNIGFFPLKKTVKKLTFPLWIFLYGGIISSILFGVIFIQPVTPGDIFNSILSASLFLLVITVVTLTNFFEYKSRFLMILFITILLVITLPRWLYKTSTISKYFTYSYVSIPNEEIEAGEFIKDLSIEGNLLVFNENQLDAHSSYVSFLSGKNTYLSGQVIMGRHGVNPQERVKIVKEIHLSRDEERVKGLLDREKISLLYFYGEDELVVDEANIGFKEIFKNGKVKIYRYNKK